MCFALGPLCAGSSLPCTGLSICSRWAFLSSCGAWTLEFASSAVAAHWLLSLPCGTWDLNFLTRDQSLVPCIGRWFLTAGPSRKSWGDVWNQKLWRVSSSVFLNASVFSTFKVPQVISICSPVRTTEQKGSGFEDIRHSCSRNAAIRRERST